MRGHSSKESDFSDMNIPLTSAQGQSSGFDNNNSNASIHSQYPLESPPLQRTTTTATNKEKVHKPPSALKSFLANFTGQSSANQEGIRIIYLNNPERNGQSKYLHNRISTSKYNYFTFLPKFLFEQFSKYANVFFLFTACIQVNTRSMSSARCPAPCKKATERTRTCSIDSFILFNSPHTFTISS